MRIKVADIQQICLPCIVFAAFLFSSSAVSSFSLWNGEASAWPRANHSNSSILEPWANQGIMTGSRKHARFLDEILLSTILTNKNTEWLNKTKLQLHEPPARTCTSFGRCAEEFKHNSCSCFSVSDNNNMTDSVTLLWQLRPKNYYNFNFYFCDWFMFLDFWHNCQNIHLHIYLDLILKVNSPVHQYSNSYWGFLSFIIQHNYFHVFFMLAPYGTY